MRSVLVTGAGGSAGNNVCWALRVSSDGPNLELTGTDADKTSLEINRWIDNAYRIAGASSQHYISTINKITKRRNVELVMPQPDVEVERIAQAGKKVDARVFLPDASTVSACQDKYESLRLWHEAGLRESPLVIRANARNGEKGLKQIRYPRWLRASHGAGGLMSFLARNDEEARCWIALHRNQGLPVDFVAEEYLPGRDFCFMSIWKRGELVTSMVRERLSWVGNRTFGTGGTSKLNRVVHSERINDAALRAIRAISSKPHGIFCVDLKESENGQPRPTEINCRFTTNVHYLTLASIKLGHPEMNFPWIAARIALDENIPHCNQFDAIPAGIWFTKNVDMGFTMVDGDKWKAVRFS
ncbi:hypothetical protein E6H36_11740 [Candidatus Bathyarchaeota archaeon]|nr:MAG: hypothetical protein E6H36_11740 [Candidatus Bathyarchaeota archaeon]TMI32798.1 MAG: hypothetical protein E6H29_01770 [Candidatus Bathyarchaeota archaeon]